MVLRVPALSTLLTDKDRETLSEALAQSAENGGLRGSHTRLLEKLAYSLEDSVVYLARDNAFRTQRGSEALCIAGHLTDAAPLTALLEAVHVELQRTGRFNIRISRDSAVFGTWAEKTGNLVACTEESVLDESLRVAVGESPSFLSTGRAPTDKDVLEKGAWLYLDPQKVELPFATPPLDPGSELLVALQGSSGGLTAKGSAKLFGANYPRLGTFLEPSPLAIVNKLPKRASVVAAASLGHPTEKTLGALLTEVERLGISGFSLSEEKLVELGLSSTSLSALLDGEVAVALFTPDGKAVTVKQASDALAAVFAFAGRDKGIVQKAFTVLADLAKKDKTAKVKKDDVALSLGDKAVRVLLKDETLYVVVAADAKARDAISSKVGQAKESLEENTLFTSTRTKLPREIAGFVFVDGGGFTPSAEATIDIFHDLVLGGALTFNPSERGLDVSFDLTGAPSVVVSSAVSLFRAVVFKARDEARVAAIKRLVASLAVSASQAFERERNGTHALCASAQPVPDKVPAKGAYQPSDKDGADFQTGDDKTGWRCLKYASLGELHYQLEYRTGERYKGPGRGGPDPGRTGFEVSAEGDLDGDGKTSLFTMVGRLENGHVRIEQEVFTSDPME
ncbi:MAG: hypothetical protein U0271_01240 [Polyangiaceae bacterium]